MFTTILAWIFCCLTLAPFKIYSPAMQRSAGKVCLLGCRFFWRWPFVLCPWIRVSPLDLERFESLGNSGKPAIVLGNHTSFADVMIFAAFCPYNRITRFKSLAASSLFKLPLVGTIMRSVGHIPVHFSKPEEAGSFSVAKEKAQKMMTMMEDHIENGGSICIFPEGQVHRGDPRTLQAFRRGGFSPPLKYDLEIWGFGAVGNCDTWPRKMPIGGLPANIFVTLFPIAPDGATKFVNEECTVEKAEDDAAQQKAEAAALADKCQIIFQKQVDELFSIQDEAAGAKPGGKATKSD
jgi:1-acyl-sn-glycerol-3-phosphate acyltransferase